jgi:integrase/recombinase XerC
MLDGSVTDQSSARLLALIERLLEFLTVSHGVDNLDQTTPAMVLAFVQAPDTGGAAPSLSVMHLRRCAVRILFRIARQLGLATVDPTIDLDLPPRTASLLRPLTNAEATLCRAMSMNHLEATRLPAAWALAEAGIRSGEMAGATVSSLDLGNSRVWVGGCRSASARWVDLSRWGRQRLEHRLHDIPDDPEQSLVNCADGSAQSRQAASCIAVTHTLVAAGLSDDPGVRPLSVTGWAGRRVFDETGRVEDAARVLGMRSLDRTARLIGVYWNDVGG